MNFKLLLQTLSLFAVFYPGNFFFLAGPKEKQLKEDYYPVGALKKGTSGNMDYEDLSFLGVESVGEVTFFSRLQIRGAIIHSRSYDRVSRRNNYTVVYQEGNSTFYGQIEVFFVAKDVPRICCGAVVRYPVKVSVKSTIFSGALLPTLFVFTSQTGSDLLLSLLKTSLMCVSI